MDILWLAWILFDLLPETSDMHIHGPDIPRILVPPYKIEQILPAVHFIRVVDQKLLAQGIALGNYERKTVAL